MECLWDCCGVIDYCLFHSSKHMLTPSTGTVFNPVLTVRRQPETVLPEPVVPDKALNISWAIPKNDKYDSG